MTASSAVQVEPAQNHAAMPGTAILPTTPALSPRPTPRPSDAGPLPALGKARSRERGLSPEIPEPTQAASRAPSARGSRDLSVASCGELVSLCLWGMRIQETQADDAGRASSLPRAHGQPRGRRGAGHRKWHSRGGRCTGPELTVDTLVSLACVTTVGWGRGLGEGPCSSHPPLLV